MFQKESLNKEHIASKIKTVFYEAKKCYEVRKSWVKRDIFYLAAAKFRNNRFYFYQYDCFFNKTQFFYFNFECKLKYKAFNALWPEYIIYWPTEW